MNIFRRFVMWLLRVEFVYEVRSVNMGGRNSYGILLGQWHKYSDAKKQFNRAIQNKTRKRKKTITIRMLCITDAKTVFTEELTATKLAAVPETQHVMARDLPYPAPESFDGKDHLCDTMGGLIIQKESGLLVPCCGICGQPTD